MEAYLKIIFLKNCFLLRSDTATSIKEYHKLTLLDKLITLYKSMSQQINRLEEKLSQVTKIFEQEYENSFPVHVDKEKLVNISSGAAMINDVVENILNMVDFGKSRGENVGQNQLVSKDISFHAPIKKNNYK